jgi:hypothetical protein
MVNGPKNAAAPHPGNRSPSHDNLLYEYSIFLSPVVSVCGVCFCASVLPCPEFVLAALPGNMATVSQTGQVQTDKSICFTSYRRYQCLSSRNPDIGTQTQFKVHSAPTDCMGSMNKYLICRDRDLNPGPSARKASALTIEPPKPRKRVVLFSS